MSLVFETTDNPDPGAVETVGAKLAAFNDSDVGESQYRPIAIFIRDAFGALAGGLTGNTGWGWLYIQRVWISEPMRGQGLAGELLQRVEAEAKARGCHSAYLDTFNPHALKAYRKAGYKIFGALENFPEGRSRTFLRKRLSD